MAWLWCSRLRMGQRFSTANPHKGVTYGTDGTTVSSCLFCDIAGGQGSGDAITPLLYEDERVAVGRVGERHPIAA